MKKGKASISFLRTIILYKRKKEIIRAKRNTPEATEALPGIPRNLIGLLLDALTCSPKGITATHNSNTSEVRATEYDEWGSSGFEQGTFLVGLMRKNLF